MAATQHLAGRWIGPEDRAATSSLVENTRQRYLEALQNPNISQAERAELTKGLNQLGDDYVALDTTIATSGSKRNQTKRSQAAMVFREFDNKTRQLADSILIGYGHLLGDAEGVRAGVTGDTAGKGAAAAGSPLPPDEALALFRSSPEEFSEYYRALSPEDRQLATMSLQDEMQAQNQIYSLLSNLAQSEHQTGRAVIGNIRV